MKIRAAFIRYLGPLRSWKVLLTLTGPLKKKKSLVRDSLISCKTLNINLHSKLKVLLPPPVLPISSPPAALVLKRGVGIYTKKGSEEGSTDRKNCVNKDEKQQRAHLSWWTPRKPSCWNRALLNDNKLSEAARNSKLDRIGICKRNTACVCQ